MFLTFLVNTFWTFLASGNPGAKRTEFVTVFDAFCGKDIVFLSKLAAVGASGRAELRCLRHYFKISNDVLNQFLNKGI